MESSQIKVAIYGVCKNEESNIREWHNKAKDADYIFLLDTGSTDNTVSIARSLGINVIEASISPWSEIVAKNTALSLLPKDIDLCICLDIDQIITTNNWRNIISYLPKDFGVITLNYKLATGYKDHHVIQDQPLAHSRNNVIWIKYRPRPIYVGSSIIENIHLPIDVYHMPGSMDRFFDREPLYIETYEREKLILEKYSDTLYKYEIYGTLALSYFEIEDLEKFDGLFDELYNSYDKDFSGFHFGENILMKNLYFAKSLSDPRKAEKLLASGISKEYLKVHHDRFYVRLAIISAISEKYKELEVYIEKIIPTEYTKEIYNILLHILDVKEISEQYLSELILYYGNIEYGKWHPDLAKKSFEYFRGE